MSSEPRPSVAVFGAGAVGCYFGGMLARAGISVTLIGRSRHVDAVRADGLLLESAPLALHERIPVAASTDPAAAEGSPVVLLCVKAGDTESAALALAPHLAPEAVVVSLQNGIDNAERIERSTGSPAVPAVVYVAAEMAGPGHVRHTGRGDLILGETSAARPGTPDRLHDAGAVAPLLRSAGIPCTVSREISRELWLKLIVNCAYNAISALTRSRYGPLLRSPSSLDLMREVVEEAVRVARATGVRIEAEAAFESCMAVGRGMEGAISSMAQDLARGAPTEIEALNGTVSRRASELGIAVPVNRTLTVLVKELEARVVALPPPGGRDDG